MSRTSFINGSILTPAGFNAGALTTNGAHISAIDQTLSSASLQGAEVIDLDGGYLMPGFIDTQVNGGGGVLFNDMPTAEAIAAIGAAHATYGTTGFMPTLISDDLDVVEAALRATEQAIEMGVPGVLGIHIEGPFINEVRKGTHDPAKFKRLNAQSLKLLTSMKKGKTMVTLAPELATMDDIKTLVEAGVIVAAGHTDARYEVMTEAFAAGVTGITHLFNAMSPMTHRALGVVGASLENQTAYCGIIVDGRHVAPAALRIALRCRPHDRFMLVTDAMPTVGSASKTFKLQNLFIRVEDGVCVGEDGTLAGSDLDMASAVRNAVTMLDLSLAEAGFMAASSPAQFLGLSASHGSLSVGRQADMVWLNRSLEVMGVWRAGQFIRRQLQAA